MAIAATGLLARILAAARRLRGEVAALYYAVRDPRTPWAARAAAAAVVAYALSPIDLIPDFIPVLGYLDDLLLVPLGVALAVRLIPPAVMAEARVKAQQLEVRKQRSLAVLLGIALIWLGVLALVVMWIWRRISG